MKFSKHIFVVAAIATVSVIGMAGQVSQRSVASDKTEDQAERTSSVEDRVEVKFKALEGEMREHTRKDDTQEDQAQRAQRVANIKTHYENLKTDLGTLEDRMEAKRNKDMAKAKAEWAKMTADDAQQDAVERQARQEKAQKETQQDAAERQARHEKREALEKYISSNYQNDVFIVKSKLQAMVDAIKTDDAAKDAYERNERSVKFEAEMTELHGKMTTLHSEVHAKKDSVRRFLGLGNDND